APAGHVRLLPALPPRHPDPDVLVLLRHPRLSSLDLVPDLGLAATPAARGYTRQEEMALITEDVAAQLKAEFARLGGPVRLAVFSAALADPESEQVKRLVEELAAIEPRIAAESYNFVLDKEKVAELGIQRI